MRIDKGHKAPYSSFMNFAVLVLTSRLDFTFDCVARVDG